LRRRPLYAPTRTRLFKISRACVLLTLLSSGIGDVLCAQKAELPASFYIVSMVTSDASPFWFHYILDVRANGRDSIVHYIRVAPWEPCPNAITVKATTARLNGVSPSDLIPQGNLCAIDTASVNRELERRTRTAAIADSVRIGIVATCGSRTVALHLPFREQVNFERLRKTAPKLARWWDLPSSVKERTFGPAQIFYGITTTQDYQLQRDGQTLVPELLSGRFDLGLRTKCWPGSPCRTLSFRDELQQYVGPVGEAGQTAKLIQANQYSFSRYIAPKYPALAMQARIMGTVKLELSVDTDSGEVRNIKIVSGHPLFLRAVTDAVKEWRFVPEDLDGKGEQMPVDLVFDWACPKPLAK
jgi:TonB family protein